ncbi:hypothetical protein [Lewinella sp. LCG006]|uniref:hypothetical protein n=1 Tax=Lewinella sp. LCG006 TaxID=3231911 RepID=UPI00345FB44D
MDKCEKAVAMFRTTHWVTCYVVGFCYLVACGNPPPPPPTPTPSITLTPEQETIYNTARNYRIQIRRNLNEYEPDGARKFFDRDYMHSYIQQLALLPQVSKVIKLLEEFTEIQNDYYEVGYKTKDYEIVIHKVKRDDYGNIETLQQISTQRQISPRELMRFNPNDITPSGNINIYPQDSLPTLVFYKRKHQ